MSSEFITRAELLEALNQIAERAREQAYGSYHHSPKLEAKAEVCEELKTLLTLPEPSIAAQARTRKWREQFHSTCTCEPKTGMFDPDCLVHRRHR